MRVLTTYDLRSEDFGSPQERHRKFIVAAPEGMTVALGAIDPPATPSNLVTFGDAVMHDWIDHDPDFFPLSDNELCIYVDIKDGGNWEDSERGREYAEILGVKPSRKRKALLRRMSSTKRAQCITAAPPLPANYRCDFVHPTQLRHITVGEQKRLMELPDSFLLAGPIEDRWRQAGNAVIPSMAELVGRKIIEASKAGRPETRAVKAREITSLVLGRFRAVALVRLQPRLGIAALLPDWASPVKAQFERQFLPLQEA